MDETRYSAIENGKPRQWVEARRLVGQMEPWFRDVNDPMRRNRYNCDRTEFEHKFDNGVMAAAELVRRLTGDNELALAIHEACIWRQREHEALTA